MGLCCMDRGPTVYFEKVGLRLGGNVILRDVDFTVAAGSIHCVIGPNGGGKTSLMRSLLGQMPHTGNIRICWNSSWTLGYVPQSLDFDDTLPLTVSDFMTMIINERRPAFLGLNRDRQSIVQDALVRVGMIHKTHALFGSLSGGERQRVLLAQALMPEPSLLVLDEPANGLDQAGSAIMESIVQELRSRGTTVLIIHHDLGVVQGIADCVTCLNRDVLFTGSPEVELTPERIFSVFSSSARAA